MQADDKTLIHATQARIATTRARRREARRHDSTVLARADWLKGRLAQHTLSQEEAATVIDCHPHTVRSWLVAPTARMWQPITATRAAHLWRVLPEAAPLSTHTLDRLGWHGIRRVAYLDLWGQDVPGLTGAEVRAWRLAHSWALERFAETLELSCASVRNWESDRFPIHPLQQKHCWWIMQREQKACLTS